MFCARSRSVSRVPGEVDRVLRAEQVGLARSGRRSPDVDAACRACPAQHDRASRAVRGVGVVADLEAHHVREGAVHAPVLPARPGANPDVRLSICNGHRDRKKKETPAQAGVFSNAKSVPGPAPSRSRGIPAAGGPCSVVRRLAVPYEELAAVPGYARARPAASGEGGSAAARRGLVKSVAKR